MKKLFHYLGYYRLKSVLSPLFKLLEASLELAVPLIVARIIDRGIAGGDLGYALRMCLVLMLLGLVGLVFSITAQYFAASVAVLSVGRLKSDLFRHIQTLSYTEIDTLGTSSLITRMTGDANLVQTGVNLTLRLLLRSPFVVFGAMIMAFTVDARSGAVFAGAIPVLSAVIFGIMLVCLPLYKKVQQGLDRVLLTTRENLIGVRVIRAFCVEEREGEQFARQSGSLTALQKRVGRVSALLGPMTYVLINLAVILLLQTGAVRVSTGALSQGQVVALYNYMAQILVELIKLANLIINITKSVASVKRISAVFDIKASMDEAAAPAKASPEQAGTVEFRNVSLRYAGAGENSLESLSFSVRKGKTVGIIGGTGSGKTSLVNLIPRFYDATAGEVLVDGVNVKNYPALQLRSLIGIVPQKAVLFKGTIGDNLRWGNENASDAEIMHALETAQAKGVVDGKGGLGFELEQEGRNLSGGQKQRLTIARALVKKPEILILDDSSSALDFATDAALRKAISAVDGTTVFIVSQRVSSIMSADKIIVLDDGKAAGVGTHEELLASCGVYREICDSQFRKEA